MLLKKQFYGAVRFFIHTDIGTTWTKYVKCVTKTTGYDEVRYNENGKVHKFMQK